MSLMKKLAPVLLGALLIAGSPLNVQAGDEVKAEAVKSSEELSDEAKRAHQAADVLESLVTAEDADIPQELLDRATGIAVIPKMVKGAVGVGGSFGKGLVAKRAENGSWGAPAYIDMGGVSYGLQLGVQATDLVLVFTEKEGLEALLNDKIELGADASIAAGPLGRNVKAGTNLTLDSAIYSYSRTKGVFAGVSVDGGVVGIDDSANKAVYGPDVSAEEILNNWTAAPPAEVTVFAAALEAYAPASASME